MRIFFLFILTQLYAHEVDIVVFSFDRPLQLYAFLESLYSYSSHIHETSVIYRCSHSDYDTAYAVVFQAFPKVRAIQQKCPSEDFKSLVIQEAFKTGSAPYIAFAVDDMIVTGEINFNQCITVLEATQACGFYLRLGQNIDDCSSSSHFERIPPLTEVDYQIYLWELKTAWGDWAYPHTVDMAIYRKKEIERCCREEAYFHPNSLEDRLQSVKLEGVGLCYATSLVVNIPLNLVSETSATQHVDISPRYLLDQFNRGLKLDISKFHNYRNRSTHWYTRDISFVHQ
ncbi:MAG TPA: hypothetical protein VLF94_04905 [Chlamydiales bacterium]|nr:hypothetical protein [Chlamydiales bacterium]